MDPWSSGKKETVQTVTEEMDEKQEQMEVLDPVSLYRQQGESDQADRTQSSLHSVI